MLSLRIMAPLVDVLPIRPMMLIPLVINLDADRTAVLKTALDAQLMLLACQLAPLAFSAMWYSTMAAPVLLSVKFLTALSAIHSTIAVAAALD